MKKLYYLFTLFVAISLTGCQAIDEWLAPDLNDGLYAYYTFEGNANNTVKGAPKAQQINSPKYVDGMKGTKAIKFSAKDNNYLSVTEAMIDGGTFTVSFWVSNLGDGHIFHIQSGSYARYIFGMTGGFFKTYMYGRDYGMWVENTFAHESLDYSSWNMITITSTCGEDNSTHEFKLYINGELVDLCTLRDGISECEKFIFGGKYYDVWHTSNMVIDNLRIYDTKALSDVEMEYLYNTEK